MSTISFSSNLQENIGLALFDYNPDPYSNNWSMVSLYVNNLQTIGTIKLMSGAGPSMSGNVLVGLYATTGSVTQGGGPYARYCAVTTQYAAASASGVATWFWWYIADSSGSIYGQLLGTVGLAGSGADLIMGDTTIISGSNYRIADLRMTMPATYTY
jgi:hypothetical protein